MCVTFFVFVSLSTYLPCIISVTLLWNYSVVYFSLYLYPFKYISHYIKMAHLHFQVVTFFCQFSTYISFPLIFWHFPLSSYYVVAVESKTLGDGGVVNYNSQRLRWAWLACSMICIWWVMIWILFGILWNRFRIRSCIFRYIRWRGLVPDNTVHVSKNFC